MATFQISRRVVVTGLLGKTRCKNNSLSLVGRELLQPSFTRIFATTNLRLSAARSKMFPLITLEDHFVSPTVRAHAKMGRKVDYIPFPQKLMTQLEDLTTGRITEMDANKLSLQIVSHAPFTAPSDVCSASNNELAEGIKKNPTRLGGFVRRRTNLQTHGRNLLRRPQILAHLCAKAKELDTPIYIHPAFASEKALDTLYRGHDSEPIAKVISGRGWGWHSEIALHIIKLWSSGLFDKYPKLKIVIGHIGEMLPFQLDRIYTMTENENHVGGLFKGIQRSLREVWRENIWVTTSGMFTLAPFACLLRTTDINKIMFSIDCPFAENAEGLQFMQDLIDSGMVGEEDLEKIAYKNAEKLLGVKAVVKNS